MVSTKSFGVIVEFYSKLCEINCQSATKRVWQTHCMSGKTRVSAAVRFSNNLDALCSCVRNYHSVRIKPPLLQYPQIIQQGYQRCDRGDG